MKKKLLQFSEIQILRRNEKLRAEGLYLLNSESVAQNIYFETKRDIKWAHRMIQRHLEGVMEVVDYLFTPNGWILIVAVRSEDEILEQMELKEYKSKTIKVAIKKKQISVILSELMRYVISGIARIINRNNIRGGTLVRSNFNRFVFCSTSSYRVIMKKMKKAEIKLCHQRKRYRANMKWFDKEGELKKGDVFLSGLRAGENGNGYEIGCLGDVLVAYKFCVLRKMIKTTFNKHFSVFQPKSQPI